MNIGRYQKKKHTFEKPFIELLYFLFREEVENRLCLLGGSNWSPFISETQKRVKPDHSYCVLHHVGTETLDQATCMFFLDIILTLLNFNQ